MTDGFRILAAIAAKLKAAFASDMFTGGVAVAAIISPAWLPMLTEISAYAALLMPIFGVTWLIVQIYAKIRDITDPRKK